MIDEEFTQEQMAEQRQIVSRLRSELKAFNKARATMSKEDKERTRQQANDLQDQYDRALAHLNWMKDCLRWNRCIGREYASMYIDD